ncbi:MAG: phosphate signaling complex protein PhoU [Armatimonadota bacterium]|nr:phosphate signaling complex protein PhoU [Armatimonadota bacterium]MDR7568687.1 phosphate signaling complex protein PhoU [Armatimonadota bacterium]MDR7602839.1 phosphate signaling complex protein PhoU [Armatimonadota bacterium]
MGTLRHIREAFDEALQSLEEEILRMGSLAGDLIHRSVEALRRQDTEAAEAVIREDDVVDRLHLQIEDRVVKLLATQQPMAGDLRVLTSALAISIDLERLADHAEGIAKAVRRLANQPPVKPLVDIPRMEQLVQEMLQEALQAFAQRDPRQAEALAAKDDQVDDLRSQVFRELITYMMEDPRTISRALDLLLVAQHLERAADHVTNIAERIIYMVTGELRELNF